MQAWRFDDGMDGMEQLFGMHFGYGIQLVIPKYVGRLCGSLTLWYLQHENPSLLGCLVPFP